MKTSNTAIARAALMLCALAPASCEPAKPAPKSPPSRPITVIELQPTRPQTGGLTIGIVSPYREQDVGFDVGGRVQIVEDLGHELRGPTLDANERVIPGQEGEIIARLDPVRYQLALAQAEASLASAQRGLEARLIQAEIASTSDLEQAKANLRIAEQELAAAEARQRHAASQLARTKEEFAQHIASQARLDADQAEADRADAGLESARQTRLARRSALASARSSAKLAAAQVEQARAEIAQLEQRVARARRDLDDCTLRAPFSGRITRTHVGRGGMVQSGAPVVTLTAMNPMQVAITVSGEQSRKLLHGTKVALYPRELGLYTDEPALYGSVFGKAEIADAATRTFRIDIIARNLRRSRTPRVVDGKSIHPIESFMPVMREEPNSEGPMFVAVDCIEHAGDGHSYVYLLPELVAFTADPFDFDRVLHPRRIAIEPLPEYLTFVNFRFQRIADTVELTENSTLIRDPRPEYVDGVTVERYDWLLRPGDLVPVAVAPNTAPKGFYVPVDAISSRNGHHRIFVIEGDRCRAVEVDVHNSSAALRRIEGPGLAAGVLVAHEGVHYLADGDHVRIVDSIR